MKIDLSANTLITGQAGTGKTTLVNEIYKKAITANKNIVLTASTGVAATNINGITIHSFLGSRLSQDIEEYKTIKINPKYNKEIKDSIKDLDILIVDEVSMLSASYIDMIDYIFRKYNNNNLPFGGKVIVFVGDFLQLPPVAKNKKAKFAFESKSWKQANINVINLTKIFRQNDNDFISMLSKIRMGDRDLELINYLNEVNYDLVENDSSVKLFSRNINVDSYNQKELDKLDAKTHYYEATEKGNKNDVETLKKRILAPEILELKVGARVISLKNDLDFNYVNGSTGVVTQLNANSAEVDFDNGYSSKITYDSWDLYNKSGESIATIEQIPLKLAYAITMHKSQGMTIDNITIDCEGIFEDGQFYVSISRAVSLKGLKLVGFNPEYIRSNDKAKDFYLSLKNKV